MARGQVVRVVLLSIAIALLLVLGWTGIDGGIEQISNAHTTGRKIQTASQLAYGALSVLNILTVFWAQRWNRPILVSWTILLAVAGGLGAYAWGGTSAGTGLVSGLAAGLIGAGIGWLLRFGASKPIRRQES